METNNQVELQLTAIYVKRHDIAWAIDLTSFLIYCLEVFGNYTTFHVPASFMNWTSPWLRCCQQNTHHMFVSWRMGWKRPRVWSRMGQDMTSSTRGVVSSRIRTCMRWRCTREHSCGYSSRWRKGSCSWARVESSWWRDMGWLKEEYQHWITHKNLL